MEAKKKSAEEMVYNGDPLETEEKVLFHWESDSRLFKPRGKDFYSTLVVLAILISIIMFFIEGVVPVFLIWSVVFVIWVLSKTPPAQVAHKITDWGIRTEDELYRFEEMANFWFEQKWNKFILRVLLLRRLPGQLVVIVHEKDVDKIKELLGKRVILEKPKPTWSDRASKWLSEKVPLED